MKREEIEKMEAGRELDALIAETVMGWEWWNFNDRTHLSSPDTKQYYVNAGWERGFSRTIITDTSGVSHYSTDIAAAWLVVEKMRENPRFIGIGIRNFDKSSIGKWNCWVNGGLDKPIADVYCDTAPLAICRAALLAVMDGDRREK